MPKVMLTGSPAATISPACFLSRSLRRQPELVAKALELIGEAILWELAWAAIRLVGCGDIALIGHSIGCCRSD